jgi:hypothetical protein
MLNPRVVFNLYNNILGRVVLIGVVLFFTTFNVTLGLLAALCLIIMSNMFFMEGLDNLTIGEDNMDGTLNSGNTISVETKDKVKANAKANIDSKDGAKISELQEQSQEGGQTQGVDKISIQETIQSKNSKTMPPARSNFNSEEVSASDPTTTEPFMSSYSRF